MAELLSYGSLTSQALHLSLTAVVGELVGGDGRMVQPLYLGPTGVVVVGPGFGEIPEIIDSLELVPVVVDSEAEKPKPEVVDSSALKPTIIDSGKN